MSERVAPPPPLHDQKPGRLRRLWIRLVLMVAIPVATILVVAVLGVMALGNSGWRTYHAGSIQMLPNLAPGDRYLVDPRAYDEDRQPSRGDIVIVVVPQGASAGMQLAIRVVGLPGEEVAMRRGIPIIDGESAVQEPLGDATYGSIKGTRLREHFPDGTSYDIMRQGRAREGDDGGPFIVPPDSYFVLGDNRDDAIDSRHPTARRWSFIPGVVLAGQAKYIYWPAFDRLGRIGMALK